MRRRWDDFRHAEPFAPAPQAAYPALRKQVGQSAVWNEVRARADRAGVDTDTEAIHDVYEHHRGDLDGIAQRIGRRDGQVGTIAAVAGSFVVLDRVCRPDVWAALHGPIVQGYALDALETLAPGEPPALAGALAFAASGHARALHHEGELIALTVFG